MPKKITIGVSGSRGSFSEEAAVYYCAKNKIKDYTLDYLINSGNVLKALTAGKIDKGVFPIENSNGGIVTETVYAMAEYKFAIEALFEIDVQHCLLARPGKNIGDIKRIVSHPQALKQCRMYLARRWNGTDLEEYSDTASAAMDLSAGRLPENAAVIAPRICYELYGLDILEQGIQDLKFNFTTFITAIRE